jgi:DNA-binding NtrC family response regulator
LFLLSENELYVTHKAPVLNLPDLRLQDLGSPDLGLQNRNKRPITILLIDDDLNERRRIESYLHTQGLKFESAHNVPDALNTLCSWFDRGEVFDLIIANRWMPDMDGLGLAECLHDDTEFNHIPFVLINSGATLSNETIEKTGLFMVIEKPVLPEHINALISRLTKSPLEASAQQQFNDLVTDSIKPHSMKVSVET